MSIIQVSERTLEKVLNTLEKHGVYFSKKVNAVDCFDYMRVIDGVLFFRVKPTHEKYIHDRFEHFESNNNPEDLTVVDLYCGDVLELRGYVPKSFLESRLSSFDIRKDIDEYNELQRLKHQMKRSKPTHIEFF